MSDQTIQIANLKRQLYDQPDPEPEPVSEQLERNALALEKFVEVTSSRKEPDHFGILKERQAMQSRRHLLMYRGYGMYKQRKTPLCPCGKHKGIEFLDKDGDQVDHLCPKHWWVIQTWVAMDDHKIGAFVDSTPMEWYLDKYRLEA